VPATIFDINLEGKLPMQQFDMYLAKIKALEKARERMARHGDVAGVEESGKGISDSLTNAWRSRLAALKNNETLNEKIAEQTAELAEKVRELEKARKALASAERGDKSGGLEEIASLEKEKADLEKANAKSRKELVVVPKFDAESELVKAAAAQNEILESLRAEAHRKALARQKELAEHEQMLTEYNLQREWFLRFDLEKTIERTMKSPKPEEAVAGVGAERQAALTRLQQLGTKLGVTPDEQARLSGLVADQMTQIKQAALEALTAQNASNLTAVLGAYNAIKASLTEAAKRQADLMTRAEQSLAYARDQLAKAREFEAYVQRFGDYRKAYNATIEAKGDREY
jgi:hypothetical protein